MYVYIYIYIYSMLYRIYSFSGVRLPTPYNVRATVSVSHDPVHGTFSTVFTLPILWMEVFVKIRRLSLIPYLFTATRRWYWNKKKKKVKYKLCSDPCMDGHRASVLCPRRIFVFNDTSRPTLYLECFTTCK